MAHVRISKGKNKVEQLSSTVPEACNNPRAQVHIRRPQKSDQESAAESIGESLHRSFAVGYNVLIRSHIQAIDEAVFMVADKLIQG